MGKKVNPESKTSVSADTSGGAAAAPAKGGRTAHAKAPAGGGVTERQRATKAPAAVNAAPEKVTLAIHGLQEAIAQQAYRYWEERGRRPGSDVEDWLRAEAEVRQSLAAGE